MISYLVIQYHTNMEFVQRDIVNPYVKTIRQLSYLPNTYQPVVWLCLAKFQKKDSK